MDSAFAIFPRIFLQSNQLILNSFLSAVIYKHKILTEVEVEEHELIVCQQISKIFFENSISGNIVCSNDAFNRKEYESLLLCCEETMNIKDTMVQYVWDRISESQKFHGQNQKPSMHTNINWVRNTYDRYCNFCKHHIVGHCCIVPHDDIKDAENNIGSPTPPLSPINLSPPPITSPKLENYFKFNVDQKSITGCLPLSCTKEEIMVHNIAAVKCKSIELCTV